MTATPLPAMAAFLRLLASLAAPPAVISALVQGPLSAFGATTGSLVLLDGDDLVTVASHGYPEDHLSRYHAIPMSSPVPFVRTVRDGLPVVTSTRTLLDEYPLLSIDATMWTSMLAHVPDGVLVDVPLSLDDTVVGAYGFLASDPGAASPEAQPALLGLATALGLWLTHPRRPAGPPRPRSGASGLGLTPRQAAILSGVQRGHGNATIALQLECSPDTVKADLQRAMRVLGVSSRGAAVERATELGMV